MGLGFLNKVLNNTLGYFAYILLCHANYDKLLLISHSTDFHTNLTIENLKNSIIPMYYGEEEITTVSLVVYVIKKSCSFTKTFALIFSAF